MNTLTLMILCFGISLIVSWGVLHRVVKMAYSRHVFDLHNSRKIHTGDIPRLGGVAYLPSILLSLFVTMTIDYFANGSLWTLFGDNIVKACGVVTASLIIYLVGLCDDLKELRYRVKFLSQIAAGLVLCFTGTWLDNLHGAFGLNEISPWLGFPVTIFACIFVINAINFIDGIDGLASSLGLLSLVYYLSLLSHDATNPVFLFTLMALAFAAGVIIFLCYNLGGSEANKTKVFMGDGGSNFLGLFLTIAGIELTHFQLTENVLPHANELILGFAPLTLPCYDVLRVVFHRLRSGSNPFEADNNHLHHKLMNLGLSQRATLVTIICLSIALIIIMVLLGMAMNINLALLTSLVMWFIFNLVLTLKVKKIRKTNEY